MKKLKHLEGLRGIAAIIVVLHHLKISCYNAELNHLLNQINQLHTSPVIKSGLTGIINLATDGSLAVWIFWVLSSYVLSILLFAGSENSDKILIGYFSKRYIRLSIPVLFSVLFAFFLLKMDLMYNQKLADMAKEGSSLKWLNNFYKLEPDFFGALKSGLYSSFFSFQNSTTYNAVLWTIQKEFIGSLFMFAIFGVIKNNRHRYFLYLFIAIILFSLNLIWLVCFLTGYIMCDFDFSGRKHESSETKKVSKKRSIYYFLFFLIGTLLIIYSKSLFDLLKIPGKYRYLILSFYIVLLALKNPVYKQIFSGRIMFFLGQISFMVYLLHLPIICSLTSYLILMSISASGIFIACLISFTVIIILGYLFTKYIDRLAVHAANKVGDFFKRGVE